MTPNFKGFDCPMNLAQLRDLSKWLMRSGGKSGFLTLRLLELPLAFALKAVQAGGLKTS